MHRNSIENSRGLNTLIKDFSSFCFFRSANFNAAFSAFFLSTLIEPPNVSAAPKVTVTGSLTITRPECIPKCSQRTACLKQTLLRKSYLAFSLRCSRQNVRKKGERSKFSAKLTDKKPETAGKITTPNQREKGIRNMVLCILASVAHEFTGRSRCLASSEARTN